MRTRGLGNALLLLRIAVRVGGVAIASGYVANAITIIRARLT